MHEFVPLSCLGLLGTRRVCQTQERPAKRRKVKLKLRQVKDIRVRAQNVLQQTIEDLVVAQDLPRDPDWVDELPQALDISLVQELNEGLKRTVDAPAAWMRLAPQDAKEIVTSGTALIVEVVASLPPKVADKKDAVWSLPKDEAQPAEMDASNAKRTVDTLSSACKAYMAQLGRFSKVDKRTRAEKAKVEDALGKLGQKLAELIDVSASGVNEARRKEWEAKQTKETCSAQIADVVRKRHEELVRQGETEASAILQSVVDVWKQDDVQVQTVWASRSESEEKAVEATHVLKVAEIALTFYENLWTLFEEVHARREEALTESFKCFEAARIASEAHATAALEECVPMLTQALGHYLEFHSLLQEKATMEVQEQQKALATHHKFFGDAALLKKGDIQRRIQEFIEVKHSSMQTVTETAAEQQQLWKGKQSVLPESVRLALIREYKMLFLQLSGPVQDAMKRLLTTIEKAADGVSAKELNLKRGSLPPDQDTNVGDTKPSDGGCAMM